MIYIAVILIGAVVGVVLLFAIFYFMSLYDDYPEVKDWVMWLRGYHKEGDQVWRKKK